MKLTTLQAVLGSAALLASLPECAASSAHRRLHPDSSKKLHAHKHHHHKSPAHHDAQLAKRGQCAFPTDEPDLVAVTPGSQNAGWAMSPDQPCLPGHYCPYACKPGMVMAQWDPESTYSYPASMNGGLFCDKSGTMQKPFPSKPLCVQGTGVVKAVNKLGGQMSWCQTVLPGNEAMLIPTVVGSIATLSVPDTSYWQGTAAHFYINGPGTDASDCIWGDSSRPIGNWCPYVAGANTDASGNTFVKIGMNPIWEDSDLKHTKPSYGVKIECDGNGCLGLPCSIEPGTASVTGGGTEGAGGAAFCVATVPKGSSANIVVYGGDDAGSDGDADSDDADSDADDSDESSTTSAAAPTSSFKAQHAAGFAEQPKSSSAASTTTSAESTTTSAPTSAASTTSSHAKSTTSSKIQSTTTEEASSTTSAATSDQTTAATSTSSFDTSTSASLVAGRPTVKPGIFHENSTSSSTSSAVHNPSKSQPVVAPTQHRAEAVRHSGGAFAGLVIAFIATACLF